MSDAKAREAICRIGASIFERGLTAGVVGQSEHAGRRMAGR